MISVDEKERGRDDKQTFIEDGKHGHGHGWAAGERADNVKDDNGETR
jgi:hypothetical protein